MTKTNGERVHLDTWNVPTSWTWTSLGEMCRIVGGGTPSTRDAHNFDDGDIPWITPADLSGHHAKYISRGERNITRKGLDDCAARILPTGSVLFSSRAPVGYVAIAANELTTNQGFRSLVPPPGLISDYLYYYLHRARGMAKSLASGTTFPEITGTKLALIPLPVPPASEQHRIVTEIEKQFSRLDAGVAALKRVEANLKRYKAAVLKAACTGALTADWRAAHPDVEPASKLLARILKERRRRWEEAELAKMLAKGKPPKDDRWKERYEEPRCITAVSAKQLPFLPAGWLWVNLEQITLIQGGIQKQPSRVPKQNAFPFLRVANVLRNCLDLGEVHRIELFAGELSRLRLEQGDMLIVEGNGSRSEIGRCALWAGEITNCVHQNHIIRARPIECLPAYLNHYWNSPQGIGRVMERAASTSGLYTLSVQKVSMLPVALPPLDEQRAIVEQTECAMSACEDGARAVSRELLRASRLRQSILRDAFEGKLVEQDPTDEPASVLLERIRAEREKQVGKNNHRSGARRALPKRPRTARAAGASKGKQ